MGDKAGEGPASVGGVHGSGKSEVSEVSTRGCKGRDGILHKGRKRLC